MRQNAKVSLESRYLSEITIEGVGGNLQIAIICSDCLLLQNASFVVHMLVILRNIKSRFESLKEGGYITVDSRYLELQGTLWNTSRYPYFDISDLRNWGKQ